MKNILGAGEEHVRSLSACRAAPEFHLLLSQIQKMGLQPGDISMFSTLMDLVREARELAEQNL